MGQFRIQCRIQSPVCVPALRQLPRPSLAHEYARGSCATSIPAGMSPASPRDIPRSCPELLLCQTCWCWGGFWGPERFLLRLKLCPRIVMDLTGIPMEKKRGAVGLHPEGWDELGPSGRVEMGAVLWRSSGLHGKLRCVFGTHWDSKVA